jgi:hypothetical protein
MTCLVAALVLACGFGVASFRQRMRTSQPASKDAPVKPEASAKPSKSKLDDKEFLRRVCQDL